MKKIALALAGMLALGGVASAPSPAAANWGHGYRHHHARFYGPPVRRVVVHRPAFARPVIYRSAYYHPRPAVVRKVVYREVYRPRPVVTRVVYRPATRIVYRRPVVRHVVHAGFYQPRPFVTRVVYRDGFRRAHWGGRWGGGWGHRAHWGGGWGHRWGGH